MFEQGPVLIQLNGRRFGLMDRLLPGFEGRSKLIQYFCDQFIECECLRSHGNPAFFQLGQRKEVVQYARQHVDR